MHVDSIWGGGGGGGGGGVAPLSVLPSPPCNFICMNKYKEQVICILSPSLSCPEDRGGGREGGATQCGEHTLGQHSPGLRHSCGCGHLHRSRDSQCDEHISTPLQGMVLSHSSQVLSFCLILS